MVPAHVCPTLTRLSCPMPEGCGTTLLAAHLPGFMRPAYGDRSAAIQPAGPAPLIARRRGEQELRVATVCRVQQATAATVRITPTVLPGGARLVGDQQYAGDREGVHAAERPRMGR
jgi:hypothetical protein